MCRSLRECLGLHGTPKSDIGSESSSDLARISELEGIIQEIFPQNSFDSEETEPLDSAEMASDPQDCQAEGINLQENLDSTPMPCMVSVQEREKELAITSADPNYSMVLEESKDSNFADSKHGGLHPSGLAAPDPVAPDPQQKYEITYEDAAVENEHREKTTIDSCPSQLSPPEQKQENSRVIQEKRSTWIPDILKNGVLTADPSRLLTLLLIVSALLINAVVYNVSFLTFLALLFHVNVWFSQFAYIDDGVYLDDFLCCSDLHRTTR